MLIAGTGVFLGVLFAKGLWIYAAAMVGLVVLVLWPIEATLGAYAFLLPFDAISRLGNSPDGKAATWYAGALASITLLGMGLLHDKLALPLRATKCWFWFLILGVLSIFWALDEDVLLAQLPTVLGLFGLYFAASCFDISQRQFLRVARLAVAGGVAASLFSTVNFLQGVATVEARSSLITGAQQADPNIFAASLLVPLALAIGLAISAVSKIEKLLMACAAGTLFVSVLLTMSRGALLALVFMAGVYAYRYRLKGRVLLALAVAPLTLLLLPALFFLRLQTAIANGGAGRLDIWIASLSAVKQYSLRSAGLENFSVAYQQFAGFAPVFRGYNHGAHNIYLQTAVELGILGIVLLLYAVGSHLKDLRPVPSHRVTPPRPMMVACETMAIGMLVAVFFVGMLWEKSFWMVWIFCALVVRAQKQSKPEIQQT
jgi:O-antigen ligase